MARGLYDDQRVVSRELRQFDHGACGRRRVGRRVRDPLLVTARRWPRPDRDGCAGARAPRRLGGSAPGPEQGRPNLSGRPRCFRRHGQDVSATESWPVNRPMRRDAAGPAAVPHRAPGAGLSRRAWRLRRTGACRPAGSPPVGGAAQEHLVGGGDVREGRRSRGGGRGAMLFGDQRPASPRLPCDAADEAEAERHDGQGAPECPPVRLHGRRCRSGPPRLRRAALSSWPRAIGRVARTSGGACLRDRVS